MVDIDRYGLPIRVPSSESPHMSSDSFWAKDNSDSLITHSPEQTSPTREAAGSQTKNEIIHKYSPPRTMWPPSAVTDSMNEAAAHWQLSSSPPVHHQPSSSSLTASLQCSVSDLRLCLGLQMPENAQLTSAAAVPHHSMPRDLTESEAELAELNAFDPCFFSSLQGDSNATQQATSLSGGLMGKRAHQTFAMPSQSVTQSAYVGRPTDKRDVRDYRAHSKEHWADGSQQFSDGNAEIDLSDISLRFSPFKSMTGEPFPAFFSSDDGDSSFSSSADNSKTLADASDTRANKNNYFLTFQDDPQQSGISMGASMRKSDTARTSPSTSIFASREGKMDDSGAVSSTDLGGRDSRHTSTTSNKMKCWTDVIDDDGDEDDVFKEQSFIASLSKERKVRSTSAQKLSTATNGSSENLTSGYSTSSMNGSVSNGTGAYAYRPQLLQPTQRVRQSPSLPLNLQNGGDRMQANTSSQRPEVTPSSIPRSRCSAPDLKFLTQPQFQSNQTRVPVQHPLSCPSNSPGQSKLPFRVNNIEDWDSLRVLLPAAFQRAFSGNKQTTQNAPHPTRSVSLPDRMGASTAADKNVCPTCFKMQRNILQQMASSACDCSSSSDSSADEHESPPSSRRVSVGSLLSPAGQLRRNNSNKPYRATPASNLMEFSRHLNDNQPAQLIINLKQKQELVTIVKAAAMGLVGFRQIQKDHSDNLSHVIEHQLTSALHSLMEDGLRPGCTVWSSVVKQCSPTLYRRHLATMIEANESLTTDEERFHAFIKELLRLSDLNAWLIQVTQGNDPSVLRQHYSMEGFIFLANSVTKNLWDDLMDTLSWLSGGSQSDCYESFLQADTGLKHSPRYQTSPGRQAEQNATSNSVKRLASKLGRRISLLPMCSPSGSTDKKSASAGTKSAPPPPPVPPRKMFTPVQPTQSNRLVPQPHLVNHMNSRWSEWALSRQDPPDRTGFKTTTEHLNVPITTRSRKSPSMYDIRSVVV